MDDDLLEQRDIRAGSTPDDWLRRLNGHASREEPNLISTVAHELRTPLTAIAASSELLLEDLEVLDLQQIRGMLMAIARGTTWMQGLVENLLCAATIREGRMPIQPHPIKLMDVVRDVRPVVEPILAQKAQPLRVSARRDLPDLLGDPRRIGQVLVNLITNASKFTEAGRPIDLILSAREGYVRVSVADRGPGLSPGVTARLFEPFFRSAAATRSGKEGVGLGLSIVKSIVEAHGGRLGAENRRGGGARFWFELPERPVTSAPHLGWETFEGGKR